MKKCFFFPCLILIIFACFCIFGFFDPIFSNLFCVDRQCKIERIERNDARELLHEKTSGKTDTDQVSVAISNDSLSMKDIFLRTQDKPVSFFEEGNESILKENCPDCLKDLIDRSLIPDSHNLVKLSSADALLESETFEGISAFVTLMLDSHYEENNELKDGLMLLLADADSLEVAKMLTDILTGEVPPYIDWSLQPDDIKYAIEKSICSVSDKEAIGEWIADKYQDAPLELADQLLSIKSGIAKGRLAIEAFEQGDLQKARELVEDSAQVDDTTAVEGIMLMARKEVIDIEKASNLIAEWTERSNHDQPLDLLVDYLADHQYSIPERSAAALALASSKKVSSLNALRKACEHESDSVLKDTFVKAIAVISKKLDKI